MHERVKICSTFKPCFSINYALKIWKKAFTQKCSSHLPDYYYKSHCTVRNANLICGYWGINDTKKHANLQKHKENSKAISIKSVTYILTLTLSLLLLLYAFKREETLGTTIIHKIFETNSSFQVKQCTMGKV